MALEALGGAASVIAILELTVRIAEGSLLICQKLKDAPVELKSLHQRIELVLTIVHEIQALRLETKCLGLPDVVTVGLLRALRNIEDCIEGLVKECKKLPKSPSRRAALQWMLVHGASVRQHEAQLAASELDLNLFLILILR